MESVLKDFYQEHGLCEGATIEQRLAAFEGLDMHISDPRFAGYSSEKKLQYFEGLYCDFSKARDLFPDFELKNTIVFVDGVD